MPGCGNGVRSDRALTNGEKNVSLRPAVRLGNCGRHRTCVEQLAQHGQATCRMGASWMLDAQGIEGGDAPCVEAANSHAKPSADRARSSLIIGT